MGASPDHLPLAWQVLISTPAVSKVNPDRQLYTASEPNVVPGRVTLPLGGGLRIPQSTTLGRRRRREGWRETERRMEGDGEKDGGRQRERERERGGGGGR